MFVPDVLTAAAANGVGVSFHIEPYGGRSPQTFLEDLRYIHEEYGSHAGVYRQDGLPVFWLYDVSAEHSAGQVNEWREVLDSVRNTPLDAIFYCLVLRASDADFVVKGGFDGGYSYFAAAGFTEASTPDRWAKVQKALASKGKAFIPAVGPGYNDTLIRPWNAHNVRPRNDGASHLAFRTG